MKPPLPAPIGRNRAQQGRQRTGKPLALPSGATGFTNDAGQWVCTGSQMGRRNSLPDDTGLAVKLRFIRLPFVDGDYDRWGAYWGSPANVWCYTNRACVDGAYFASGEGQLVELFVRANSREQAKAEVRKALPQARFYR